MRGWLAAALVLFAASVSAQPLPDGQKVTLGAVNQVGISNTVNDTTILVQVQGSWTGTITFEGSLDGATYTTLNCTPINGTTAVTTTTGNGIWSCNVIGINFAQARMSAFTAGTATVSFMSAYVSGGGGGASSGSSGTVTINDPSVTSQKAAVNASGQLSVVCANCSGSGVSVLEDVPAVNGDAGTPAYAVRSDTLAGTTSASGDWTWLKSDALGALWTNPYSTTPSALTYLVTRQSDGTNFLTPPVDYTQDGALTVATTAGPMNMCRTSTATPGATSADDDAGMLWCTRNGALNVSVISGINVAQGSATAGQQGPIVMGAVTTAAPAYTNAQTSPLSLTTAGAIRVDNSAVTQPVSGTVTVTQGTGTNLHTVCDSGCGSGTQYTQDAALTVGSTVGTMAAGRASAAAPTDVSADNDAVIPWYLRSGAQVHQPSYAGVLATTGNGASGTGVPRVTIANDSTGQVALAAGSALIGQAAVVATATTTNAATPYFLTSAASTNSTSVKGSAGNVYNYHLINTTATLYYLRMYNASSAPTCSSATNFVKTIPIPAATTGAGISVDIAVGEAYSTGIAFCLTGGGSSTDNTNAATGVYINIDYK